MLSSIHHGAVPRRPMIAALRNERGERIGRFGLDETSRRCHRWEWLETRWPDTPFSMVPDPDEAPPAEALSEIYALPPEIHPLSDPASVDLRSSSTRLYDVVRIDGVPRRLAVLAVGPRALEWIEVEDGGVLEALPAWLTFSPRPGLGPNVELTRRLVQRVGQPRAARAGLSGAEVDLPNDADLDVFRAGSARAGWRARWSV